jgi:hypothetical protein
MVIITLNHITARQSRRKGEILPFKPKSRIITGMEKAEREEIKVILKDWVIHNPLLYTDDENLRWCWLRAVEWGQWPLFTAQLVAPILLLFILWWKVAVGIVILTWLWALIRYRYVNIILAGFGPYITIFKWPVSVGIGIYFLVKGDYLLAAISGFWPVITLLLMALTPTTKIGVIQNALMKKLGYEKLI